MSEPTREREEFLKWIKLQPMIEPLDEEKYPSPQVTFDLWLSNREKDEEIAILRANRKADKQTIADLHEYIKLLGKELDGIVSIASMHGWKSSRYEQGKILRAKCGIKEGK